MNVDQDLLLYPLATEELPSCPACGCAMGIVLHEARDKGPDFSTFRGEECSRSERFVCEE
jgi:hypothetical protein